MSTLASHPRPLTCHAVLPAPGASADALGDEAVEDGSEFFPQAVASGQPDANGVVLWTRAVDPRRPQAPLTLTLQVARDARFVHRVLELPGLRTTPAHDHTLKVRVTHLTPSTAYHYRFVLTHGGRRLASPGGRTRTGPSPSAVSPVHFVVASARELLGGDDALWRRLLRRDEDPDFILLWGESLLEVGATPALCRSARAHPTLRLVHARYPLLLLWEHPEPRSSAGWSARRALCDYLPVSPGRRRIQTGASGPTWTRDSASFATR